MAAKRNVLVVRRHEIVEKEPIMVTDSCFVGIQEHGGVRSYIKSPLQIRDRPIGGQALGAAELGMKEESEERRDGVTHPALLAHPAVRL